MPFKLFKKSQESYTLEHHLAQMEILIKDAEKSPVLASNEMDASNAQNQINFAIKLHDLGCQLVKGSKIAILLSEEKKSIAREMSTLAKSYFGDEEVPDIIGPRSAEIADILLKNNFESFIRIEFSDLEKNLSEKAASLLRIESIPQQIEKTHTLKEKLYVSLNNFKFADVELNRSTTQFNIK